MFRMNHEKNIQNRIRGSGYPYANNHDLTTNYPEIQSSGDSTIYFSQINAEEAESILRNLEFDRIFKCEISPDGGTQTVVKAVRKNGNGQMCVCRNGLVIATNDKNKNSEQLTTKLIDVVCEYRDNRNNPNELQDVIELLPERFQLNQLFNNQTNTENREHENAKRAPKTNNESVADYTNKIEDNATFMENLAKNETIQFELNIFFINDFINCCNQIAQCQDIARSISEELRNIKLKMDEHNGRTILNVVSDSYKAKIDKKQFLKCQEIATKTFKCITTIRENHQNKDTNIIKTLENNLLSLLSESFRGYSKCENIVRSTKLRSLKKCNAVDHLDDFLKLQTKQAMLCDINRKIFLHLNEPRLIGHMDYSQFELLKNFFVNKTQHCFISWYPEKYIVVNDLLDCTVIFP